MEIPFLDQYILYIYVCFWYFYFHYATLRASITFKLTVGILTAGEVVNNRLKEFIFTDKPTPHTRTHTHYIHTHTHSRTHTHTHTKKKQKKKKKKKTFRDPMVRSDTE